MRLVFVGVVGGFARAAEAGVGDVNRVVELVGLALGTMGVLALLSTVNSFFLMVKGVGFGRASRYTAGAAGACAIVFALVMLLPHRLGGGYVGAGLASGLLFFTVMFVGGHSHRRRSGWG